MKNYDVYNWYWIVGGDATHVYSSKLRNYVVPSDPAYTDYADWGADGTVATQIDTEHTLGTVMAVANVLRPIPAGVLEGFKDALTLRIAQQPDFTLWAELYQTVLSLSTPQAVLDHIKVRL